MEPKKANDPDELGGWRINGRLGEGGFGTVFLAEKGAQKAAIKVIRQEFVQEEDARSRLATEAEVLSKLSDPSIGKILDSDLSGEFPWIATEFINGPTLDEKVRFEGPLGETAWFNLAANIFHAIVSANEVGIIHKDIKPSNIILGETGNKLIDFGIAHISGQTKTRIFGDREGSTPFSSPEHFTIKSNPKMDVFSAASTLVFAGKGSGAWVGENDLQLMRSINDESPNLEGLTDNQVNFLLPLFEKNPSDRVSAIEAEELALNYIAFLLGKRKKPDPRENNRKLKSLTKLPKKLLGFMAQAWSGIKTKKVKSLILLTFIFVTSFGLDKLFGIYFWTVFFLLVPLGIFLFALKTYRRGLGQSNWGRKSPIKVLLVTLLSMLMPIVLIFTILASVTVPLFVQDLVWSISPKEQSDMSDTNKTSSDKTSNGSTQNPSPGASLSQSPAVTPSTSPTIKLSAQQYAKQEACVRISYEKKYKEANTVCLEIAKLGDAKSQYALGYNYAQLGDSKESDYWLKKAASQNWPEALAAVAWNEYQAKNYETSISYATKAADLGSTSAMNTLGIIAEDQKRWNDAVFWYKKTWELKEVWGAINLGEIYLNHFKDNLTAEKWYLLAAKTGNGEAEYVYGEFLRKTFSKNIEACTWFKKSSDHNWSEGVTAFKKYCATANPLPSPSSTKEFTQSAPEAKDVVVKSIFGRVSDAGIDWNVPLTNTTNEQVPPITGLQFRLIGYTNKIWLDIAYKLKKTEFGVQAQVDQLLLSMLLNKAVCPEFRFVQEVKGEIKNIWVPGQPDCATDFIP